MHPVETFFIDGHLAGHICQDIGFEAFDAQGCHIEPSCAKLSSNREVLFCPKFSAHLCRNAH